MIAHGLALSEFFYEQLALKNAIVMPRHVGKETY
jgi:hypothetical protein